MEYVGNEDKLDYNGNPVAGQGAGTQFFRFGAMYQNQIWNKPDAWKDTERCHYALTHIYNKEMINEIKRK